jgi:hypothetical protein
MGEAKRRKMHPDTPKGSAGMPVEDFRVAVGMVGLTLDLHGVAPVSIQVETAKLDEVLVGCERSLKLSSHTRHDVKTHVRIRRLIIQGLQQAKSTGDDRAMTGIGMAGLWCALNHPTGHENIRRQVSEALRRTGKAHITMSCDALKNFAFAVGDKFVELGDVLAEAKDLKEAVTVTIEAERKPTPQH